MNCARAQEYLSDLAEGSLAGPLSREVASHVESCDRCAPLSLAMEQVATVLRALAVAEPPEGLTERVFEATLPELRRRALLTGQAGRASEDARAGRAPWQPPQWSWIGVAAAIVLTLLWRPPELLTELSREASQSAYRIYSLGVRTYQETERWVDDLNVLRMTVGVAFEDRIDHLTERLRDLDAARRRDADDEERGERDESSSGSGSRGGARAAAASLPAARERTTVPRHSRLVRDLDPTRTRTYVELCPPGEDSGRGEPVETRRRSAVKRSLS